jgi:hypothetical protein
MPIKNKTASQLKMSFLKKEKAKKIKTLVLELPFQHR